MQLKDARDILPEQEFNEHLGAGVKIQHLADYIRAKALIPDGGWWIDCDCVWMRQPEALSILQPDSVGHFFGSLRSHPTIQSYTSVKFETHWLLNYLKEPSDKLYLASPFAFPAGSPVLKEWVASFAGLFALGPTCKYDSPLIALAALVHKHGLDEAWIGIQVQAPWRVYFQSMPSTCKGHFGSGMCTW